MKGDKKKSSRKKVAAGGARWQDHKKTKKINGTCRKRELVSERGGKKLKKEKILTRREKRK